MSFSQFIIEAPSSDSLFRTSPISALHDARDCWIALILQFHGFPFNFSNVVPSILPFMCRLDVSQMSSFITRARSISAIFDVGCCNFANLILFGRLGGAGCPKMLGPYSEV